jgi:hypothetical protein
MIEYKFSNCRLSRLRTWAIYKSKDERKSATVSMNNQEMEVHEPRFSFLNVSPRYDCSPRLRWVEK